MQCQFCMTSLLDSGELQLHQLECQGIHDKNYVGSSPATVTFMWKSCPPTNTPQNPHLILSNIDESIQLVSRNDTDFASENTQIHPGVYTGQIVLDNSMIAMPEFTITPSSKVVCINTETNTSNENETITINVIVNNDTEGSKSFKASEPNDTGILSITNTACLNPKVILEEPILVDYALNKQVSITKKIKACDRSPYSIKLNNGSATVTLNTICFELMRTNLLQYLANSNMYKIYVFPKIDTNGNTSEDTIKVAKIETPDTETHMYTINLYRTTSRLMINGPQHNQFVEKDLPLITDKFDNNDIQEMEISNQRLKDQLLTLRDSTSASESSTNDHTNAKKKSNIEKKFMTRNRLKTLSGTAALSDCGKDTKQLEVYEKNLNQGNNVTRRSSRCIIKTQKAREEEERIQNNKSKTKTNVNVNISPTGHLDSHELDPTNSICPHCSLQVNDEGVVCEKCQAYWHYSCAGVNSTIIESLDGEDFLCYIHKKLPIHATTTDHLNVEAQIIESTVESPETLKNEVLVWQEKFNQVSTMLKKKEEEIKKILEENTRLASSETYSNNQKNTDDQESQISELHQLTAQLKQEVIEKEKSILKLESSLEIINKKCASLEKEKLLLQTDETKHLEALDKQKLEIQKLEKSKTELQREIDTHKKINEELITLQPSNKDKPVENESMKEKKKEIDSLKLKVSNLETIVKEKQKLSNPWRQKSSAAKEIRIVWQE